MTGLGGRLALLGSVAVVALSTGVETAWAQTATGAGDAAVLEEVYVTARRRDERLVDVPVAVTAVGQAALQQANVTQMSDLTRVAPTLELNRSTSGGGGSFKLRGLGSTSNSGIEQTVALNFDGVQLGRARLVRLAVFDIEVVEVLKGPQALFFGKNSPGGVVSMRSTDPTSGAGGYLRAGVEYRSNQRFLDGAVNLAPADDWRVRVAGRYSKRDGWVKNTAPDRRLDPIDNPVNTYVLVPAHKRGIAVEEAMGRVTVLYEPQGPFRANLKMMVGQYNDNGDAQGYETVRCADGQQYPTTRGVQDPYGDCSLNLRNSVAVVPELNQRVPEFRDGYGFGDITAGISSLTLSYELGQIDLTSITGYYGYAAQHFGSSGYSGFNQNLGSNNEFVHNYSEEVRANSNFEGPINFTVGAYVEQNIRKYTNIGRITPVPAVGGVSQFDPRNGQANDYRNRQKTDWTTLSAFGQLRYKILQNLELAAGARWTKESKEGTIGNVFLNRANSGLGTLRPEGDIVDVSFEGSNVSPEVTLTYQPSNDITIYGAYKTGYKSGGFSNPGIVSRGDNADTLAFDSETAKGGEIGVKVARPRLTADFTVYRYDFSDLQVSAFDNDLLAFFILNAASARTQGAELQVRARPISHLTLSTSVNYNDATYLEYTNAACYTGQTVAQGCVDRVQDLTGEQLASAPKWIVSAGFEYDHRLSDTWDLLLTGTGNYRSEFNPNGSYDPRTPTYGDFILFNASARLSAANGWSFAVIGTNLTDEIWAAATGTRPGAPAGELAAIAEPPRQVTFQAEYRF